MLEYLRKKSSAVLIPSFATSSDNTTTENAPKYSSLGDISPISFDAETIESPLPE